MATEIKASKPDTHEAKMFDSGKMSRSATSLIANPNSLHVMEWMLDFSFLAQFQGTEVHQPTMTGGNRVSCCSMGS